MRVAKGTLPEGRTLLFFIIVLICNQEIWAQEIGSVLKKYRATNTIGENTGNKNDFFSLPSFITSTDDTILIADSKNNRIVLLDKNLNTISAIGRKGKGPGEFLFPSAVRIHNAKIFVAESNNQRIQIVNLNGKYLSSFSVRVHPLLSFAVDSRDNIYMTSFKSDNLISQYDSSGKLIASFGETVKYDDKRVENAKNLGFVEVDEEDNVFTAFYELPLIRKYDKKKNLLWETDISDNDEVSEKVREIKELNKKDQNSSYSLVISLTYHKGFLYCIVSPAKSRKARILKISAQSGRLDGVIEVLRDNYMHSMTIVGDEIFFTDRLNHLVSKASPLN